MLPLLDESSLLLSYQLAAGTPLSESNRVGAQLEQQQLTQIEQRSSYPTIEHQRGIRALTMTAEIDGNPLAVIGGLEQSISGLKLPSDIQWGYTGEYGELLRTGGQLLWVLLASALLVYGIIAIQLGNLLDPAIVLTKLPLDFMGAALALFITRQHLDLTVAIGFITLVGVSTNNGIMLLTFTPALYPQVTIQSFAKGPRQGASRREWLAVSKGRNAALDPLCGSVSW